MDAVVLDLVVSLATAEKEEEDLFRGVLEVGLSTIMLSVDLEEAEERMDVEEVQEEVGDILVEHREIIIMTHALGEVDHLTVERGQRTLRP